LQVRDFVHVEDIVQANMLAMQSKVAVGESLNVASGKATSILELFKIIRELIGAAGLENVFAPSRAGDMKLGLASIDKIRSTLGYSPKVGMHQGLVEVIESLNKPQALRVRTGEVA
jgi:nucleoside-diphosphate-sugar epimerase